LVAAMVYFVLAAIKDFCYIRHQAALRKSEKEWMDREEAITHGKR